MTDNINVRIAEATREYIKAAKMSCTCQRVHLQARGCRCGRHAEMTKAWWPLARLLKENLALVDAGNLAAEQSDTVDIPRGGVDEYGSME